jgi:transcriptional regulator with XRE-family HTH domain
MDLSITQQDLGHRISQLRKQKGFSQEELAKIIHISRSSLTQIELGKRAIDTFELLKFSIALRFSIDEFLSESFSMEHTNEFVNEPASEYQKERVSEPLFNPNKFRNVLLYILERCAGKPNVGETVLYKLMYFSDFNYYEIYEEHLSGASYKKLPYGPVPQKFDSMMHQLIEENLVQRIKTNYHGYLQTRYLPLEKPDLTKLKASEIHVIDKVIDQMGDWSANAISDYSHGDMPWLVSQDGAEISYELVFYREKPYSVRIYEEDME